MFSHKLQRGGSRPLAGIVFLKPPKCGGTTVALTLARAAEKNGLEIGRYSKKKSVFDLWIHHSFYNKKLFQLVPESKGQFVGMVRDPGTRFRSAWTWRDDMVKLAQKFGKKNGCKGWDGCTIKAFLLKETEVALKKVQGPLELNRQTHWQTGCTSNRCSFPNSSNIEVALFNLISDIETGKHLFLVMERMEQSLILLRHAYNISLEDIVYFSKNINPKEYVQSLTTDHALHLSRQLQEYDSRLYEVANKTLTNWIAHCIGVEVVEREVLELKFLVKKYESLCSQTSMPENVKDQCEKLHMDWKSWNQKLRPQAHARSSDNSPNRKEGNGHGQK